MVSRPKQRKSEGKLSAQDRRLSDHIKQSLKEGKPLDLSDPIWWEGSRPLAEVVGPAAAKEWARTVASLQASHQAMEDLAARLPGYNRHISWLENVAVAFAGEYGFTGQDIMDMDDRQMANYLLPLTRKPHTAKTPVENGLHGDKEEWLPAAQAVEILQRKGLKITIAGISKHKSELATRPRTLPGRHKYEVEMNTLAAWYVRRCKFTESAEPNIDEEEDRDVIARLAKAKAEKSKGRSLD